MNSLGLYAHGFETYDVGATTGLSDEQLVQAARNLILYFNSVSGSPQMVVVNANGTRFDLYHDYELIHLADVKVLFAVNSVTQAVSLLLVVTLVLAGLSFRRRDTVCSGLRYGAIATLALLVTSALAFITNFNQMFVVFHLVAFDNPFWQLNPYTDYLVMLFPLGFWQDMFLIAGSSTGLAAVATYATVALASRSSARARRTAAAPNHAKR
jgi:integral membrane protein (TIGR01906 family)